VISTERSRLDLELIHRHLSEDSYWAKGRDRETSDRAIEHSLLVIGAYDGDGAQVAFARMVTDLATWAWLCDVFVLPDHQGAGLGSALVRAIVEHPDVAGIKWQFLATADAHDLYARFGFTALDDPARWMHRSARSHLRRPEPGRPDEVPLRTIRS
jgi:GNAT superfamily N-acetyltransferase